MYKIPAAIHSRVKYTGYIPRKTLTQKGNSVRKRYRIMDDDNFVLVTTGGGGDGLEVIDHYLAMHDYYPASLPFKSIIITGPFMPKKVRENFSKRAKKFGIKTLPFHPRMEELISAADLVISMGGYNTICEILTQHTPALIIPRETPRKEQLIRARRMKSEGLLDFIPWTEVTPQLLREKIFTLFTSSSNITRRSVPLHFPGSIPCGPGSLVLKIDAMKCPLPGRVLKTDRQMRHETNRTLGYILKGYPRISETFISNEILLLEKLGFTMRLFPMRQPRETFSHASVKQIKARVDYLPTDLFTDFFRLLRPNLFLAAKNPQNFRKALTTAAAGFSKGKELATLKHLLQAGYLTNMHLIKDANIRHLHGHFAHSPTSVTLFAALLSGLPFSFTAHAKDIYTSSPEKLRKKIAQAQFVITCTRHNAEYLQAIAGDCSTPIYCIYHGIDLELFQHPVIKRKPCEPTLCSRWRG